MIRLFDITWQGSVCGSQSIRQLNFFTCFVMELGLRPYLTAARWAGPVAGVRGRVELSWEKNEGKLRLRMLLAIYEKSQINQTNNENTPTKRRLGKKENGSSGVGWWRGERGGRRQQVGNSGWEGDWQNLCKVFLMKRFTMAILKISKNWGCGKQ